MWQRPKAALSPWLWPRFLRPCWSTSRLHTVHAPCVTGNRTERGDLLGMQIGQWGWEHC